MREGPVNPIVERPSAGFPFESRYVTVDGHRIHYVESGSGDPLLFIHGNPTWSYLWRNILPDAARESGRRGIAVDLLGFGKSDKPGLRYDLGLHAHIVEGFIEQLGLRKIVLVLHDWGGPLGARYAVRHPENVAGLALMETFLWNAAWEDFGPYRLGFRLFRSPLGFLLLQVMNIFVNRILPGAVLRKDHMTRDVMDRYREPFPTIGSRRAIRAFPGLIPIEGAPQASERFLDEVRKGLRDFGAPVLWIKADPGAIVTRSTQYHLQLLRRLLPQMTVREFGPGSHFIQEDDPGRIIELLVSWMREAGLQGRSMAAA